MALTHSAAFRLEHSPDAAALAVELGGSSQMMMLSVAFGSEHL